MHRHATSLFRLLDLPLRHGLLDLDSLRFFGIKDDASIEALVAGGVLRPAKPATQIDCRECDQTHDVIRQVRNRKVTFFYVGACGFDEVQPDELRQWSIQWKAIADWLASVVLDETKASTVVPDGAWLIGSVAVGDSSIDVLMTRGGGIEGLSELVRPDRCVLLSPKPCIDDGDAFAATLRIGDVFTVDGDAIAFDAKRVRSSISLSDSLAGNQFLRLGEGWELCFAGKKIWMKDSFGLLYIARLLAKPNAIVSVLTLLATRMGIDEVAINGSTGEVIDAQARDEYRDRYEALLRDMPKARANNDHGWLAELEAEQQALTAELSSAFGKDGKARAKSDYEKARKSVFMSIKRAIERIAEHHSELGVYLNGTIKTGGDCRYEEHEVQNWIV